MIYIVMRMDIGSDYIYIETMDFFVQSSLRKIMMLSVEII